MQLISLMTMHNKYKMYQKKYSSVASWPLWMKHLKLNLHRRMKVMRVGMKTSTSPPLSAELWESTTSPWWRIYPSIWQTLVNHQQLQSSMKSLHLTDTDAAASDATTKYSPALMIRVLWDPVNDTVHAPVLIPKVQPAGEQTFHLQCTTACVIMSHPPQTSSSQKHGLMIPPLKNTSEQHHWMMVSGLKNQFWIDACASTRDLMNQNTGVPNLVHMTAPPSGWTYCNQCHKMKQCWTMNRWTSVTYQHIFQK